jgi:hypothetical protein
MKKFLFCAAVLTCILFLGSVVSGSLLREAFEKVAKDPELQKDAERNMMNVEYAGPNEVVKIVKELLSQPSDTVKEFSKFIKF